MADLAPLVDGARDGRALVVTGGGRGIGSRIAIQAASRGMPVAFLYHSQADAAAATQREAESHGVRCLALRADVGDESSIVAAFSAIDAAFPGIRGLVNNAASNGGRARAADVTLAQLELTFRTNVFAAFLCAREAVRRMAASRGGAGGAIVNISSGATRTGSPGVWVHYAASKGAVEVMSLGLAKELAHDKIRVNTVRAGVIDTEVHRGHGEDRLQALMAMVPMARMGRPEEVAAAALWLVSEEASYVTGAVLDVTGGL